MARGEKEQNNCCQIFLHTFVYFCNALLDLRKTQVMMKVVNIYVNEKKRNRIEVTIMKLNYSDSFRFIMMKFKTYFHQLSRPIYFVVNKSHSFVTITYAWTQWFYENKLVCICFNLMWITMFFFIRFIFLSNLLVHTAVRVHYYFFFSYIRW